MARNEHHVVVGDRGRVVLPSGVRAELDLKPGSRLLLSTEKDGSLRLRPYRSVADKNRGMLAGSTPAGKSTVDELLAERRREAESEGHE
jgi:AbrB family looped-hinge helix DNA binding protein